MRIIRDRTALGGISGTEGTRKERVAHSRGHQREIVAWSQVTVQPEVTPDRGSGKNKCPNLLCLLSYLLLLIHSGPNLQEIEGQETQGHHLCRPASWARREGSTVITNCEVHCVVKHTSSAVRLCTTD